MAETPNHNYNVPSQGEQDWHVPLNENFEAFETDVELRDSGAPDSNGYSPENGAKYLDTDAGVVYTADGSNWSAEFALFEYDDAAGTAQFGQTVVATGVEVDEVSGSVTGGTTLTDIAGNNLSIDSNGQLNASGGSGGGNWSVNNTLLEPSDSNIDGISVDEVNASLLATGSNSVTVTVDGERTLELTAEDGDTAGNVLTGHSSNSLDSGVVGATISGGGYDDGTLVLPNTIKVNYGSIGGGFGNETAGDAATVAGGRENTSSDLHATVGGGVLNTASGVEAVVAGGEKNVASGEYATVAGGANNNATAIGATVGGGGGAASAGNAAKGDYSTVAGGANNQADAKGASIGGGSENLVSSIGGTVSGGIVNVASGEQSTVPGGASNLASGNYAFAAGRNATANNDGAFVVGDSTGNTVEAVREDEARFQGDLRSSRLKTESDVFYYPSSDDDTAEWRTSYDTDNDRFTVDRWDENAGIIGEFINKMWVTSNGDVKAEGSKDFVQTVDTDDGEKEVHYTATESGTPHTEASGVAELDDGRAEIELPGHFEMVTSDEEPLVVQTTPYGGTAGLKVVERSTGQLVVEDLDGEGEYEFAYTVKGTREGYESKQVVRDPSASATQRTGTADD